MFRAPIYERDWRPSCIVRRSSSSSVDSDGSRTAIRVTTAVSSLLLKLKTAFARCRNPDEPRGSLQHADENIKLCPISKIGLAKWLAANTAQHPSTIIACMYVTTTHPVISPLGQWAGRRTDFGLVNKAWGWLSCAPPLCRVEPRPPFSRVTAPYWHTFTGAVHLLQTLRVASVTCSKRPYMRGLSSG